MRALWLLPAVALSVVGFRTAHAENPRIVLMSVPGRGEALQSALQVALAGKGVDISSLPAPEGALRLDRAATAQRAALSNHADAGVWIEEDPGGAEVCVVSSDGRYFRHAPLPTDTSPRVFAAITTSLLDELIVPPEPPLPTVNVDVHVNVGAPGLAAQPSRPPPAVMTLSAAPSVAVAASSDPIRSTHTLVELGPTVSPVSIGFEGEVAFPLASSFRLGAVGAANKLLDGVNDVPSGTRLIVAGAELRHVGRGTFHFDVGLVAAAALAANGDGGGFGAVRLSAVWEGAGSGVELSLGPAVLLGFRGMSPILPNVLASLRWAIPI